MMTVANGYGGNMDASQKLLDFSQKLDVTLLDRVVHFMYNGTGVEQKMAEELLTKFKEHPDAWTRVDAILEFSQSYQTKYYALQILEHLVSTRWKMLPRDQCEGIKKYIVGLVIKTSSGTELSESEKFYLKKLDLVLIAIVKREWPKNWPTFISDIVGSSKTNENLCQNNMVILRLLSEEIFDFSAGQMTQTKAEHLKKQFCNEFQSVFQLCFFVLGNSQNAELVAATLETLLKFLNWVPIGYIFETDLITTLTENFLNVPIFRGVTLKCLTEISGISFSQQDDASAKMYSQRLVQMFMLVMKQLKLMLPEDVDIADAHATGNDACQKFVSDLALFLSTFLGNYRHLVEISPEQPPEPVDLGLVGVATPKDVSDAHFLGMRYLLNLSKVEEIEIFKICLEFWSGLTYTLFREAPTGFSLPMGIAKDMWSRPNSPNWRLSIYEPILHQLRYIIIGRMAKPEEVLIVENEQGEIVREAIKDTDAITLYKNMRETLVYLTHLNPLDTESIMAEKLQRQVNGTEWSWKNLNTLCWAIGSISGTMMEEDEQRFLVSVIRDLLGLCEQKRGKDNKAVVASNIMYVVGQYPRFLRLHWKFLKTVINKLFEFMHETHEGVQDMACDTFIKIAHKCRKHFVIVQAGEREPFVDEILSNLNSIICDLQHSQVQVFYEAMGLLIGAQNNAAVRENLIERLMALPNSVWDNIIASASENVETLQQPDVVKNLANILKTNVAACKTIGDPFIVQLSKIYLDLLNLYKVMSENLSAAVAQHGEEVLKQPLVKSVRGVKTEALRLLVTWVPKSEDKSIVLENFVPPLFEAVLFDYQRNVPSAREPEVLLMLATFVDHLKELLSREIPKIFDAVFQCTLEMINKEFQAFPEHRTNFFLLLKSVNDYCFDAFLEIPPPQFKLIVDSIIWGFKHAMRNVAEISLEILLKLLQNFSNSAPDQTAQSFYQTFFVNILEHVLSVVTDSSLASVAGLTHFSCILAEMFRLVESGKVTVPLGQPVAEGQQDNLTFVAFHVGALMKKAFPHLNEEQIRVICKGFVSYDDNVPKFKEHLLDFLVQIKEYTGEDTSDLFIAEREAEIQRAQEEKKATAAKIPGMLDPYSEMDDRLGD